jgi:hypothetical protein
MKKPNRNQIEKWETIQRRVDFFLVFILMPFLIVCMGPSMGHEVNWIKAGMILLVPILFLLAMIYL